MVAIVWKYLTNATGCLRVLLVVELSKLIYAFEKGMRHA
jgi:hypothetical protein